MNGKRLINAVYKIAVFSFLLVIAGCKENVGLGESVDTVNPEVSINYPPSGAVIMDSFYIGGECSDDKGVSKIRVELRKIGSTYETIGFYPAEIYEKGKKWKILMNQPSSSEDSYNGWTIQDGSYEVNVVAWDEAGRTSGAASRNFDIDNTAPVLVVSNPGVSVKSGRDYSSYGSSFSLEGKVADKHKINKIEVSVFDSKGNAKAGTDVNPFTETNLDSGAVSLLFARNGKTGTLADNYAALYDLSDGHFGTTEKYTCSVTLSDNAAIYKDPDSLTYIAEGNSTSTVFLNDDLNNELLSSRNGLGLAVSALYDVLSLTSEKSYTNGENTKTAEEIFKILEECKIVTKAEDSSVEARQAAAENRLGFTLNPEANPTYSVAGYLLKDKNTASSGNTISVSASYGLDQNYLDPKTFKVWIKEYDSFPESSILEEDIAAVEKFAYGISKTSAPADWIRLFDNEKYNSNSQANYTLSVTLDAEKINIQLDKYYVVVLTGKDQEGLEFAQKEIYGFIGTVSGQPPKLEISSPVNLSFVKGSEKSNLEFIGKVENSGSISLSKLTAVLKVEDENKSSDSTVYESSPVTIQYNSVLKQWESSSCLNVSSSGEKGAGKWSFVPSLCADYEKFKAEEQSGKSYLYTLSITAKAASGHTVTAKSSVHIDTIKPAVEITGITPIVDGTDYKGENDSNLYVNGEIFFTGNITETNNIEKGVSYKVLDEHGNTLLEHDFDNRIYKFNEKIDTTKIKDGTKFKIVVEAEDIVGNKGSYSSTEYTASKEYPDGKFYIVDQNSDKPVVQLKNANKTIDEIGKITVSENSFDCAYAEASINGSVIDDDGIQSVSVKIYDANENLIGGSQSFISKNNSTTFDFKFTIPKNEGLYLVQITAQDKNFKDSETTPYSEQIADKFLILVDNGAPKFSKVELPDFINSGNLEFKVSVEEKCLDSFDIQLKKDDKEVDAKDFISKSEDGKSITVTIPADPSCKNDGTWTFTATAYDKLEKSNTTLFGPVVIDTTLPVLEFTEEPSKEFVDKSTSQTYKGSVTESNSGISDVLYCLKGFVNGEEKLTEWESAAVKGSKNSAGNIVNDITFKASIDLEQFDDNSSVEVCFKAIDNAGNETSEVSKNLKLDATKPSVTFTAWDDSNPYTKETNFNLSGTVTEKNLSSLVLTVYKNDEKTDEKQWTAEEIAALSTGNAEDWSYTYNANEDGKYYFVLTAEDKAGLKDSATSKTVYVDTTGPGFSVDNVENLKNGIYDYSAYTFTGSWSDSLSGTQTLIYSVNGNETSITEFAGQKTWRIENVALTEGKNTFEFWGKDKNGNESSHVKMENVMVDYAKPVVNLKYSVDGGAETSSVPSYIADGAVLKVSGTVTETNGVKGVIVKAKKVGAEVASGNYGYEFTQNTGAKTFTITLTGGSASSGEWSFEISAEDNANREGDTVSFGVNVDVEKPVITAVNDAGKKYIDRTATNKYSGNLTETGGSGIKGVYWKAVKLPAGETADTSDIASWSECSVNAGHTGWNLTADLSGLEEGEGYRIYFAAQDNAGNISETKYVDQYLDNTAPKVENLTSSYGVETKKQTLKATITEKYLSELALEVTKGGVKDEAQSFTYSSKDAEGKGNEWFDRYESGSEYSFEISGNGSYVVKLTAVDEAGNKTTETFESFIIDTTGPVVTVDQAGTSQILDSRTYTFTGSWSDDVTGTDKLYYSVNGTEPAAESGKYPVTKYAGQTNWRIENVELTEGLNTFEFWGKDKNGNESSHVKMENVMVDFAKPVVSLTYSVDGGAETSSVPSYIADGAVLKVSGTVTETNGVKSINVKAVKNGTEVTDGYTLATGSDNASFTITLESSNASDGKWEFEISATDGADRTGDAVSTSTVVDTVKPVISVTKEPSKLFADKSVTQVYEGTITEENSGIDELLYRIKGLVNGTESETEWDSAIVKVAEGITFKVAAELAQFDENTDVKVYFKATDNAGNESDTVEKALSLDATKPVVSFTSLLQDSYTKETSISLSGTVTEKNLSSLTLNVLKDGSGSTTVKTWNSSEVDELSTGSEGSWSLDYTFATDGVYYFVLTATDKAGLTGTATSKTVYIDTAGPTVTVDQSGRTAILGSEKFTFTGTWNDSLSGTRELYYSIDEGAEGEVISGAITDYAGQSKWSVEISLTEDKHTFKFWGKDNLGNTSAAVTIPDVMVDFKKPAVTSLTYKVGEKSYSSMPAYIGDNVVLTVSGTIDETNGVKSIDVTAKKGEETVTTNNCGYTLATDTTNKTFTITLAGKEASKGDWTFDVSAKDIAEQTSDKVTLSTAVDTVKPVITAANDAGKKYIDRTATNKYSGDLTETGGSGIKGVYWKAVKLSAEETADTSDIASWSECSVNAGHTGWNLTADLSGLEEGEGYRIFFAAQDNAGNISETKYVDQYLDNTAPKVENLTSSYGVETKKQTLKATITEKYLSELALEVTKGGVKDETQSFTYSSKDIEGKEWFDKYISGSEYSFEISGDGSYVVKLTAVDEAGNKTTETFESFIIDTTGPVVSVDQAGTSQILDSRTYTFTGSWSDDVTGTDKLYYRVNGTEPAAESGKYPVTKYAGQTNWRIENVELTEGLNTFEFWGKDKNGNESSHVKMENVMVDFAKPVVSLTYSVDGGAETSSVPSYIADGAVLTVSGTVTETNGVKAVNVTAKKGESVIKSGSNGYSVVTKLEAKTFTVTLTGGSESSGEWSFEISAEDNAERTGETVSFGVNVDVEKPVITAANDAGKKYIDRTATNKYSGNLTETGGSGIKGVYWKAVKLSAGETADTSDIASWSECSVNAGHTGWNLTADLSGLEEGEGYRIFFAAQDNAGNISETKYVDQYLDNTAPKVENLTSSYGVETKKQTLKATITEKYLSELALEVTKGGVKDETQSFTYSSKDTEGKEKEWFDKYISGSEYSFEISGDGSYVVKLTAVDEAGNKTTETFESFIIDTTGPVVSVDQAGTSQILDSRTYTFTGSWSDDVTGTAGLYYSVNGKEPVAESGKYPVTKYAGQTNWRIENVALTEGANTFEFWGKDRNGNESAHVKMENVMVDFAEPVVSLTYKVGDGEATSSVPSFIADRAVLTVNGTVTESNGVKAVNVTAKKGGIEVTSGNNGYSVETNPESKTFTITLTGGSESSGEWNFEISAEDSAGRKSSVSEVKTSVDMTPPQWLASWGTNDENKFKVDNKEYIDTNWYSGAALSFNGCFLETGSGVDQIYYLVIPADESDAVLTESNYTGTITVTGDSNNYWVFNSAISGFKASSNANTVKFMAKDKAGNKSAIQTVAIKRDQIAPAINTNGSTILTNGVLDIPLSGSVSDDASGTASLEITINGINDFKANANIEESGNWTSSLPAATLSTLETGTTYEVWGKAQDKAGNISESRIAKLNVDKTPPVVKFSDSVKNQAEQGINGVKDIIGTVNESNTPKSLEFFYTLQDPSTASQPENNSGTPAGWTKIGDTVTSSQQIYNWTVSDFDFTENSSVLTNAGGTAKIYILPVAVDEAGNCNAYTKDNAGSISWNLKPSVDESEVAQWLEFNVDASLDRPLITFSDLTDNSNKKDATSLIIKNSDGGVITGLAEDDDGIEKIVISSNEISTASGKTFADLFEEDQNNPGTFNGKTSHPYTVSSGTVNGYDKFIYKNGSFEFHPANPLDGKKTIYIYVKDKAGGEFYSTYSANTGYAVQKNPRIKIKTGNVLNNTKGIEYTSDCTSPVVSSIKIATGDSENAKSLNQYSWESGRKIGGTKEKFVKFQVEASDSNGIKTVSLKLKQGSTEETLTLSGSETTDSRTATFTSTESFDLSSAFTTGEITVTATATDQTGMSGNSVILPYADFEVEVSGFSVISPAATKSGDKLVSDDILTSSLTISGSAIETSGCGIETVQWMVQPKVNGNAVTVRDIETSPSTYESKWSTGKSSATYTQWKFIFDGDTDSVTPETSGGTEISHYPKFEKITSNTTDYNITTKNGICKIPLFFKVTDKLGNVAYIDSYVLRYNPDADRPNAKILYPENGKDVGDVIRVNGSAEDNVSVSKVYIQISTVKGESGIVWNADDAKLVKGRGSAGQNDLSYLKAVTFAQSGYEAEKFPEGMSTDWWGIEASGTISWSYSINRYGEFNSELVDGKDNGTKVYLRACSIDNLGKASVWSDVVEFTVYSGVPKVEFNTIAQFEGDSLSTVSAQNTNYEAGSYLTNANGQWYLVVNASHESGISNTSVSCSTQGSPMTKQTDVSKITGSGNEKYSSYYAKEVAGSGIVPNYKLYIPVDTRYEGDVTYTVTATDNTEGLKNNTQSYTYKVDNIAPKIGELTSGNTRNPANTAVAGNKLVNSDGGSASIKSVVKEDISGFTMMAYYFIRNGKIYNPFPGKNNDGTKFVKPTQEGVDVNVNAIVDGDDVKFVGGQKLGQKLYGKTVKGAVVGNEGAGVYFKASASVTDIDSNIRSGGLILIEGIYYQISKIDGAKIYVKGLSENSKASEAFCPYALVIQYNAEAGDTTESITSGSYSEGYTVNEKDGDGIVETVNKVGTDYTLETNIMSDSIPDGEIEIVCIAFDKAGNASSSSTKTMISNNLPRVSKVWLATDLNQDNKFENDEFVWYSENNGVEVQNYAYSCLDSSGNGQEIVTLTTKDSRGNQFTVKDKLALTMELLTGGTGNSYEALSYIAKFGKEAAKAPATGEKVTGSLTNTVTGVPDSLTYTVADEEYTVSQKGILFDSGTFTSYEDTTPYLQLTLWDKVNISADGDGKFIATVDTKDANGIITSYGNQYTVLNIPIAVDITDDVAPKGTITPFYWKKAGSSEGKVNDGSNSIYYSVTGEKPNYSYTPFGHIELVEKPEDIELGKKPEVSGTVVLTGTVSDDQLMKTVTVEFTLGLGSEAKATTISATYTASDKTWTPDSKEVTKDGYQLIMSNDKLTQAEHSADWTLYLDTAKLGNAETKTVTVKVTQAKSATDTSKNTSTPDSTKGAETGYYAMKVVPYITGIARSGTTNRSRFGRYAVKEGETVTVSGFNFGTNGTVQVGNNDSTGYTCTKDSSAKDGATSFTMTVPVKSGGVVVTTIGEISSTSGGVVVTTIGKISSTNNTNDNDGHGKAPEGTSNSHRLNYYNREAEADNNLSTDYTDDRYLSVWALGNYFKGTDGESELQYPVMTADASGQLYASWGAISNSNIMFTRSLANEAVPIYRNYDQPAPYSGIAVDSRTSGGYKGSAAVTFIQEHGGNGNSFSRNGLSSAVIDGGAAVVQINADDDTAYSGTSIQVKGNPKFKMDGTNYTAFYNLANYDGNRRFNSYVNPKSARYDKYTHSIWYDNVTESLKYSVVDVTSTKYDANLNDSTKTNTGVSGGIVGWVVLDGGYTGLDRVHEFSTSSTNGSANTTLLNDERKHTSTGAPSGTYANYSTDTFLSNGTPNNEAGKNSENIDLSKYTYINENNAQYFGYKNLTVTPGERFKAGDSIALLRNYFGEFYIAYRTIKEVDTKNNRIIWYDSSYTGKDEGHKEVDFAYQSAAIYHGNMNVVSNKTTTPIRNYDEFRKTATDVSSSAGLSADIDVTSDGKPVVAYYDATNSKLKVAYATSEEPKYASNWTRVDTGLSCSGEVSMRVDSKNGIHIMFMDTSGQLCYAYAASTENSENKDIRDISEDNLKKMKKKVIDTNGSLSYGSISVKEEKKEDSSIVVIPTVTYLNRANTDDCIKYAYRTNDGEWDYQIVPSLGSGHRAIAENKISLESRKKDWTGTTDTVLTNGGTAATPATVDSVIAFKSKQFETAYLKRE